MRYIADSSGYVKEVSFGADITCNGNTCKAYTGAVPSGYKSLEAWALAETEKLYRWKIVNGNLTLDSSAVAPGDFKKSFIKIFKAADTADFSTAHNYFDPLQEAKLSFAVGNLSQSTYAFGTFGDREMYVVPGVHVGQNIRNVRVDFSVRFQNNDTAGCAIMTQIIRVDAEDNSQAVALNVADTMPAGPARFTQTGSTLIPVSVGDFICLRCYKGVAGRDIDVIADYASTQLCVEAIR